MGDKALNKIDMEKVLDLKVTDAGAPADGSPLPVDGAFITGAERNNDELHIFVDSEIDDTPGKQDTDDEIVYLARAGLGVQGPYTTKDAAKTANESKGVSYVEPRTIDAIPDNGLVYLGFSGRQVHGPFIDEQDAVDAFPNTDSFHVEPRYIRDDGTESCIADDVQPTY
jgi:hypothetical protein